MDSFRLVEGIDIFYTMTLLNVNSFFRTIVAGTLGKMLEIGAENSYPAFDQSPCQVSLEKLRTRITSSRYHSSFPFTPTPYLRERNRYDKGSKYRRHPQTYLEIVFRISHGLTRRRHFP